MRRSYDGRYAISVKDMGLNLPTSNLFVFIDRRAAQMRVLSFHGSGFCLLCKRLEQGRFLSDWDSVSTREMDGARLKMMLDGMEPKVVSKRFGASSVSTSFVEVSPDISDPNQACRASKRRRR